MTPVAIPMGADHGVEPAAADRAERFDVLVVPRNRTQQFTPKAIKGLVNWLTFNQVGAIDEVIEQGDGWTEIFFTADITAHAIFEEGPAPEPQPTFLEGVIGYGRDGHQLDYGVTDASIRFYLELRGCLYEWPSDDLLERLDQMLYLRPESYRREHLGLPPRPEPGPRKRTRAEPHVEMRAGTIVEDL